MMQQKVDILVLTALPIEYRAFRAYLTGLIEYVHPKGTVYEVGRLGVLTVAIVETGAGNERSASEAERGIATFDPRVVTFVGVGGGLKDVRLGDVVAASKIYGYESGKDAATFHPRPEGGPTSYRFEQRARAEARANAWANDLNASVKPTARVGPIAAGSKVVAETRSATAQFLNDNYSDALAVEMEGFGIIGAARANDSLDTFIVRGISDLLSDKVAADASGSQESAAAHAAHFAVHVLTRVLSVPHPHASLGAVTVKETRTADASLSRHAIANPVMATSASISPDGKRMALWNTDDPAGEGRLWLANIGDSGRVLSTIVNATRPISTVTWSSDGHRLAASASDIFRAYSSADGLELSSGGSFAMYGQQLLSPTGHRVAWGNVFGTTALTNANNGVEIHRAQLHVGAASLGTDFMWVNDSRLLVHIAGVSLQLWNGDNGNLLSNFDQIAPPWGAAAAARVPGTNAFVLATSSGLVAVCSSEGWYLDAVLSEATASQSTGEADEGLLYVAASADLAISSDQSATLRLWNLNTKKQVGSRPLGSIVHRPQIALARSGFVAAVLLEADVVLVNTSLDGFGTETHHTIRCDPAELQLIGFDAGGRVWVSCGRKIIHWLQGAARGGFEANSDIRQTQLSADGRLLVVMTDAATLIDLAYLIPVSYVLGPDATGYATLLTTAAALVQLT